MRILLLGAISFAFLSAGQAQGQPAPEPAPRACHSAAFMPQRQGIVVYGGAAQCGTTTLDDDRLWLWRNGTWSVIGRGGPGAREDALLVHDAARNRLVLYGGRRNGTVFDDTWEWRDGEWSLRTPANTPGKLEHASAAFDPVRNRVVVFGGAIGRSFQSATWEWNGSDWLRASSAPSPAARIGHSMAYDPDSRAVMMYGGFASSGSFIDLWRWNGTAWSLLDSAGPTHTEGQSMIATAEGIAVAGAGTGKTVRAWGFSGTWKPVMGESTWPVLVGSVTVYDAERKTIIVTGGAGEAAPAARLFMTEFRLDSR